MDLLRYRRKTKSKRTRGESSSSQQQPIQQEGPQPEDVPPQFKPKLTLAKLREQKIIGHRTVDWPTLDRLGYGEEYRRLLTQDWKNLFSINTPIFDGLVQEFFSTFRMNVQSGAGLMTFQLGGQVFTMTASTFGVRMGLYTQEEVETDEFRARLVTWPSGIDARVYWRSKNLGPEDLNKSTKQSSMYNIGHRLILRCISESISNRENCPNNATMQDLFYLYCILERKPCNIAWCLAHYLFDRGHGKGRAAIAGGSFVCHLAIRLGVTNLETLESTGRAVAQVRTINIRALQNMGICDARGDLIAGEVHVDEPETHPGQSSGQNPPSPPSSPPRPSSSNQFSFEGLMNVLQDMQRSQDMRFDRIDSRMGTLEDEYRRMGDRLEDEYRRIGDRQRAIESEQQWLHYHTERYQPYAESWAHRESIHHDRPLPPYAPPDVYTSPYGGHYYTSPYQPHITRDDAGTSGGGTPSVFPDPDFMADD